MFLLSGLVFSTRRTEGHDDRRAPGAAPRRDVLSGDAAADRTPATRSSQRNPGRADQHCSQPLRQRSGPRRSGRLLWPRQERTGPEEEVGAAYLLEHTGNCRCLSLVDTFLLLLLPLLFFCSPSVNMCRHYCGSCNRKLRHDTRRSSALRKSK